MKIARLHWSRYAVPFALLGGFAIAAGSARAADAPAPIDLTTNGGFETAGDKDGWPALGWKGDEASRSQEQVHGGEWSLKFPVNEPNPGKGVAVGQTADVSKLHPGDTIEISAYVWSTIPLTRKHSIDLWLQLADVKWGNKLMSGVPLISQNAVVGQWQPLSAKLTVPDDFAGNWHLRYAIRLVNNNEAATPGSLYFDDFKITVTPKSTPAQ